MANEIRVALSLQIKKDQLTYLSQPTAYTDDMVIGEGESPGLVIVDKFGVDISLSTLTDPGYCWMQNLDDTNYVEVGIYDPETNKFYPFLELKPLGKPQLVFLSRNFGEEYAGTGTGTTAPTNRMRMKANTDTCRVRVHTFER